MKYSAVPAAISYSRAAGHTTQGGQFLVCRFCGTHFHAGGGESCWGAKPGERLELFIYRYTKRLKRHVPGPTGIHLQPSDLSPGAASGFFYLLADALAPLDCPHCLKTGGLVERFEAGDACPKCHQGRIGNDGTCVY